MPMRPSPRPICKRLWANPVRIEANPIPTKKTVNMPLRFQWSAICAAIGAHAPNKTSEGIP